MKGLILKSTGKRYEVMGANGLRYQCQIRGKLRMKDLQTTNPLASGDWIEFDVEKDNEGSIHTLYPRTNYIIRKSVNLSKEAQIIASNLDLALLLITIARPQTTAGFIDRFLITAEAYNIPTCLVFNKIDQYDNDELEKVQFCVEDYNRIGYPTIQCSAHSGIGLDEIKAVVHNKTVLISGHSGVGKSTLINHLIPGLNLRTEDISEWSSKGQHTTTFAEMHALPGGGYLVDTPGIKGFGIVDIPKDEIAHYFKEFFHLLPLCKFHNCKHLNEPGCAVRKGLDSGTVSASRYNSYVSMMQDEEERSVYR